MTLCPSQVKFDPLKGMFINLTSLVHKFKFPIIRGVVSFILVTGVKKPPKGGEAIIKMEI